MITKTERFPQNGRLSAIQVVMVRTIQIGSSLNWLLCETKGLMYLFGGGGVDLVSGSFQLDMGIDTLQQDKCNPPHKIPSKHSYKGCVVQHSVTKQRYR